ncbi:MAG: CaiB/BaiF CoA-transferase family protein [Chloroflexi bacterium]|nr:CaiB/BaiF CoA-transferase family protein [Chloroflexota bacterium]
MAATADGDEGVSPGMPAWAPPSWEQLTVVQVGDGTAAAFAGRLFVELGCRVILVERPGERADLEAGSPESGAASGRSSTFTYLNWAKLGIVLDYAREEGVDLLARLAKSADVLIRPPLAAAMEERWRTLGIDVARERGLVELVISPFGEPGPDAGPYADPERPWTADAGAALALSGMLYTTGDPAKPPLLTQPEVAAHATAAEAAMSVLAALNWRMRTGRGSHIDLSMHDAAVAFDEYNLVLPATVGVVRQRFYSRIIQGYPSDIFRCRDGWLVVLGSVNFQEMSLLIGRPDLLDDRLFADRNYRTEHWQEVQALLAPWFLEHDRDEVVARAQELRLMISPVMRVGELAEHPHVRERQAVRRERDALGEVRLVAPPFRLGSWRPRHEPAPLEGEHTVQILTAIARAEQGDAEAAP